MIFITNITIKKKIKLVIISICLLQTITSTAQSIIDLPPGLTGTSELTTTVLDNSFNIAHTYSEQIYNSYKLSTLGSTLDDVTYSGTTWGEGSWGQGYFSVDVGELVYYCHDLGLTLDDCDNISEKYTTWYGDLKSNHPLIRSSARRILAYIHKYSTSTDSALKATYIERIVAGANYLTEQQLTKTETVGYEGAFTWWNERTNISQPQIDDTPETFGSNSYVTGLSLRALSESYVFFKTNNLFINNDQQQTMLNAITKASRWLSNRSFLYDANPSHPDYKDYGDEDVQLKTINYRANNIWGLLGAYRATNNDIYLIRAAEIYDKCLKGWQMPDGVWNYVHDSVPYHNSKTGYTGMILRAIAELHILISNNSNSYLLAIKADAGNQIVNTINHFLDDDLGKHPLDGALSVRLQDDGTILPYYEYSADDLTIMPGAILIQGLIYSSQTSVLTNIDKIKVREMVNSLLRNRIENQRVISDVDMVSLAMYNSAFLWNTLIDDSDKIIFYNKYGYLAQQELDIYSLNEGLVHRGNSNSGQYFDLMANGDFNGDGETDVALYRKSDGRITIYNARGPYTGGDRIGVIITNITEYELMESVDSNYDGVDEIVLYNSENNHEISIYQINNNIPVHSAHSNTGSKFDNLLVGNYNKDIKDDLAFYRNSDGKITIYQPGAAYVGTNQVGSIPTGINDFDLMANVDINKDGVNEIILYANNLNKTLNIYGLNKPAPMHTGNSNSGQDWYEMTSGDFNNDKEIELAMYRKTDGRITIYQPGLDYTGSNSLGSISSGIGNYFQMGTIHNASLASSSNGRLSGNTNDEVITYLKGGGYDNSIVIYPNPAKSFLTISNSEHTKFPLQIDFMDITGKVLYKKSVKNDNELQIDISEMEAGLYHVVIYSGFETENYKIIIE